ncbi:hypothetical protein L2Y90_21915 [Burkholderia pyrrocinia]|uniref:hypothetical protein n=1 Tax=Burkholderia pyrrocinia TaxID=60550 RepID=UPI00215B0C10|nr:MULTISPECIES: hypothetical protein [Burkholderia]UVE69383.1 hypothetical protein L2Y90_21915 [Burkholderia pyrrocinia]
MALHESLQPEFRIYANAVVENAQALCRRLTQGGLSIVPGWHRLPSWCGRSTSTGADRSGRRTYLGAGWHQCE